jgi:hypothetical protein
MAVFPTSASSDLMVGQTFKFDGDASAEHIFNEDRAAVGLPAARESERPASRHASLNWRTVVL